MKVLSVSFENYRNLHDGGLQADETTNIICGLNAQGKTNLLECLWLFTGNRSFRGAKDQELVSMGNPDRDCVLTLSFESGGREQQSSLRVTGGRRKAEKNGVMLKSAGELTGAFCAVLFSPDHLSLVKDGPSFRRGFLDTALGQIRPTYGKLMAQYSRTLQQRGALLKDIPHHNDLRDLLDVWDERVVRLGGRILFERARYTAALQKQASPIYEGISSGKETLGISYKTALCDHPQSLTQVQGSLDADIDFIPYRGDFARGIFATCVVKTDAPADEIIEGYKSFYKDAPFTHYVDKAVDLKQVVNTNKCLVHCDKFGNKLLITSCIDNLLKGAVGQAVQNMNIMFGIDETAGLRLKPTAF